MDTKYFPSMHRHIIPHLEMHITHTCNLQCKYCAHYCDFGYAGEVPFAQGAEWLRSWAKRLIPKTFLILGGEPLLHEDAEKYVKICAECFPEAERGFVTNGLLLRERGDLLSVFIETDTTLIISLHPLSSKQQENILNHSLSLAVQYKEKGLRLRIINDTENWRKLYQGEGAAIMPFTDGDPGKSFRCCKINNISTLHQNKLWKCPPLAYLPLIISQLETKPFWEPYLLYEPLEIDASDADIAAFIKRDSQFCDMCSIEPEYVSIPGTIPKVFLGNL